MVSIDSYPIGTARTGEEPPPRTNVLRGALLVGALAVAACSSSTDHPSSDWTVEVTQTAWCDAPDACWRVLRIGGDASASLEDRVGVVPLDSDVDHALREQWAMFALPLSEGDCARGNVSDLVETLSVIVVHRGETVVIDDAWGCAGYGPDSDDGDRRLAVLIDETVTFAHHRVDCPPWDAYSPPVGPYEITGSTPRFACHP